MNMPSERLWVYQLQHGKASPHEHPFTYVSVLLFKSSPLVSAVLWYSCVVRLGASAVCLGVHANL